MDKKKSKKSGVQKASPHEARQVDLEHEVARLKLDLHNFQSLYDYAPIGCMAVSDDGCIQQINHKGSRIFGHDRDDLIGRPVADFVGEGDLDAFRSFFEMLLRDGNATPCPVSFTADASEPVFTKLAGVRLPNQDICHITATDITTLTRTLDELQHTRSELETRVRKRTSKLRSLARELTLAEERERRRIAGLMHDHLQQLLVAVLLNIGAIKTKAYNRNHLEDLESMERMVKECVKATRSLTAELSPSVLHQCGLIAGFGWLQDWFKEKYNFDLEVCADERLKADSDVGITLFQCVREIVFNVVKHAGVKSARLMMFCDSSFVNISIRDEGAGFDAESVMQEGSSNGFGLFSVRERLELMGGMMEVESSPGLGSHFTLRLPAGDLNFCSNGNCCEKAGCDRCLVAMGPAASHASEFPVRVAPPVKLGEEQRPIRVVLADDHSMVRQGLKRVFSDEADFTVVGEAANSKEALKLARELEPDMVVMDLHMPLMSGLEATEQIRRELPSVQVIGLTMDVDKRVRQTMRRAGALDLLHKGGSAEDLIQKIRGHLAGKA